MATKNRTVNVITKVPATVAQVKLLLTAGFASRLTWTKIQFDKSRHCLNARHAR